MKENRFYEVVNSHRKWWLLLFWAFGIFIGCCGFPFINITKALSDTQKAISLGKFLTKDLKDCTQIMRTREKSLFQILQFLK